MARGHAMLSTEWREVVRTLAREARELRRLLGWSQEHVADLATVSQGAVSRLESGRMLNVPLHTVVVVMQVLVQGAEQVGIQLTAATYAFLSPFEGCIVHPIDPTFASMLRVFHRFPIAQQAAFVTFLESMLAPTREDTHGLNAAGGGADPAPDRGAAGVPPFGQLGLWTKRGPVGGAHHNHHTSTDGETIERKP